MKVGRSNSRVFFKIFRFFSSKEPLRCDLIRVYPFVRLQKRRGGEISLKFLTYRQPVRMQLSLCDNTTLGK